jgi:hypothetical protein
MSNPLQEFEIELPKGVDAVVLKLLEQQIAQTIGVDKCGQDTERSVDPAAITIWVNLVATTIAVAVPVIKQVLDLLKSKGIKGAKLTLGDRVFQADDISVDDLLKLSNSL